MQTGDGTGDLTINSKLGEYILPVAGLLRRDPLGSAGNRPLEAESVVVVSPCTNNKSGLKASSI